MLSLKNRKVSCSIALAVLIAGCSSEQSEQQSESSTDTVSVSPNAVAPSIPDPEPVVKEPVPRPVVANDPLSLDATPPVSGADREESVDDILAELNAINLEGEGDNSLGDPDKVVALMNDGNAMLSAGRPDAALAKYNEALKFAEDGEDSEVFFNMGIAYRAKR